MKSTAFLSKNITYRCDYSSSLHNHANEPTDCLHYHDFYELIVYFGQSGSFAVGEDLYPLAYGDIVPVDMFLPHRLFPDPNGSFESLSAQVDPGLLIAFSTPTANLADLFRRQEGRSPIHHVAPETAAKYRRLLEEYRAARADQSQDILVKAILHQLLAYAYRDCAPEAARDSAANQQLEIVTRLIHYINRHLAERLPLERLAEEVNYSTYYICHIFKAMTNRSISSYILEKRVERVTGLLRGGMTAHKAAEAVGFNSYSHFYRTFCRTMGCSPAAYMAGAQN